MRHFPIAAVLVLIFTLAPSLGLAQGLPPVGVTLGSVEERTVHDLVTGVATVEPWLRSTVAAEIAGYVESYPLREGQEVVAGETVVCELKKTTLKIDLAEAEALLLRARAEAETSVITARATMEERRALMDRAERDLARSKELFADQVINKSEFDRAEAEAIAARFQFQRAEKDFELAEAGNDPASMAAEAEVRRAEARLARVQDQIAKATILAPVSGRVLARRTEVGNWVSPGGPVIDIVTLKPALVRVAVNENAIARIQIGDDADIRADAYPGRVFKGKVRFLVPEADMRSRSFPVQIEIENSDGALLSGMFARVEIQIGNGVKALTVPRDALVTGPRGSVIFTLGPPAVGAQLPTAKMIPVVVGGSAGDRVAVTGPGIQAGLPVVTTGNEKLMPGQGVIPPRPAGGGGRPPAENEGEGAGR